jgi:hypothetical protein
MMISNEMRISEFKKVLRRYADEQVVDLDEKYTHKFNFKFNATRMFYSIRGEPLHQIDGLIIESVY